MGTSDHTPAQLLIPVPYLGTVNLWLLRGEPLTLVDTGPKSEEALSALEQRLREHGLAVEDIELLLLTHHHLDHTGLAGRLRERSGARVAALDATAAWGVGYHEQAAAERRFTETLLAEHGVPDRLVADTEPFWEHIIRGSADYETDVVLADGDEIQAGGRTLRVVHRPGHSITDTLFVDDAANEAIVGDHLLAKITSGAETTQSDLPAGGRRHALFDYLTGLRLTAAMNLGRCYSGHGPIIRNPTKLIDERFAFHSASTRPDRRDRRERRRHGVRDLAGAVVGGGGGHANRARNLGGARTPGHPRQPRHARRGRRSDRDSFLPSDGSSENCHSQQLRS